MYSKLSIKTLLEFIIDNAYFQVGDKIFKQIIGIPMGSDPAPFIANIFLYVYENRYMNGLKKSDLSRARNLRHVFRFIDDLIAINDNDQFLKSYKEIYPQQMDLKVENQGTMKASHLDLDLEIKDCVFISRLYDKERLSNLMLSVCLLSVAICPYKMFYSTISAEVLRICRATSSYLFFLESVQKLIIRMRKQHTETLGIKKIDTKMMCRHW